LNRSGGAAQLVKSPIQGRVGERGSSKPDFTGTSITHGTARQPERNSTVVAVLEVSQT